MTVHLLVLVMITELLLILLVPLLSVGIDLKACWGSYLNIPHRRGRLRLLLLMLYVSSLLRLLFQNCLLLLWRYLLRDEMLLGCGILIHHGSLHQGIWRACLIHPRGRSEVVHWRGHVLYAGCAMAHLWGASSTGRLLTPVRDHCDTTYRMPVLESRRWSCRAAGISLARRCGFHDHTLTRMNISRQRR